MQANYRLLMVLALFGLLLVACGSCSMSMSNGIIRGDFGVSVRGAITPDDAADDEDVDTDDETSVPPPLQGHEGCNQPNCWVGITPGVTTFEEAQAILENRYGTRNVAVVGYSIEWVTDEFRAFSRGLLRANDQGVVLDIIISAPENLNTLAELNNWLGEPGYVWIPVMTYISSGGESRYVSMISYPNTGIVAFVNAGDVLGIVDATLSVSILNIMSLGRSENWSITDHFQIEWQGYTDYCELAAEQLPTPISP